MANVAVIGAQWGDEGKGKVVDWLASRADIVVRFQGGHNAGHTLVVGNEPGIGVGCRDGACQFRLDTLAIDYQILANDAEFVWLNRFTPAPTSSRKSVPPSACSISPAFPLLLAPVKA